MASAAAAQCPRLAVSGTHEQTTSSWLQRLLINYEKAAKYWDAVLELHTRQAARNDASRSEEHTSELQSLMRNSFAGFCLDNKMTHHRVMEKCVEGLHQKTALPF